MMPADSSIRRFVIVAHLLGMVVSGCGASASPTIDERIEQGEYEITIESAVSGNTVLVAKTPHTNWNPDEGRIYLGTEENEALNDPIGTLTMTIDRIEDSGESLTARVLTSALSKTDVREGTSAELNAKVYEQDYGDGSMPGSSYVFNVLVGRNFIGANLLLRMRRIQVNPGDEPEQVTVRGWFKAKSE